ncbi:hypothetical protein P4I55_20895, partial [Escherichia coli]
MNLIRRVSAIYKEQELPEYRGNPLIEALPEALTEDEVLLEMSYFPEIDEKIRWTAPANVREQYVERIKKFRCPQTNLGNDSNLLIVFYVQIMPDDFVMQLHR